MRRLAAFLLATFVASVTASAADAIRLPNGAQLDRVDFDRHVAPLLGRLGCNSGACHGSFQGKGGFRLSLFGYSPADDYRAITRGARGRRINVTRPEDSLLLQKPAMQVAHEGGRRFRKDSWQYAVIRRWIAQGAQRGSADSRVRRLDVRLERESLRGGSGTTLSVTATFFDGGTQDVTPFCSFRVHDETVARVTEGGKVQAVRAGDTAIVADYRGHFAAARVLVPVPDSQRVAWPRTGTESSPWRVDGFIDEEIFRKLRGLGMTPSPPCSDTDFLRRAMIDTIGRIPRPQEIRTFLADQRPDKRRRLIDRLLCDPMHAALWATRLCDITGNNVNNLPGDTAMRVKRAKMWHDWFRKRIAGNVPWHEIARGVLTATSRGNMPLSRWIERERKRIAAARKGFGSDYAEQPFLDLYWRRPTQQVAEITAAAFLGVRIECAQCHKHPFDRWTQDDYRAFTNIFARVRSGISPRLRSAVVDLLERRRKLRAAGKKLPPPVPRMTDVYLARPDDPSALRSPPPKALAGPVFRGNADPRGALYRWLIEPDNPFFARNFVNRVWAHYFGVGLVDPVDDFSVVNPPSNARLLDRLARDFVESGYDVRRLERLILNSQTYQLSAEPNRTNRFNRRNYSRAYIRVLPAEVAVDSLQTALGVKFDFGPDVPAGCRAIEIAPNRLQRSPFAEVFRIFERPERKTACDCERKSEPNIRQMLYLMTSRRVLHGIADGRLHKLLEQQLTDEATAEELFLATLSRFPTDAERAAVRKQLRKDRDRKKGFESLFWSLLNTREFLTNH